MNQVQTTFPTDSPYRQLALALDNLPNGFPPTENGTELRLLSKLFTMQEASLAANLKPDLEMPAQIAERLNLNLRELLTMLKEMSRKGLITAGKTSEGRLGFALMPFVVGIYEAQAGTIDVELAVLFEEYYQKALGKALVIQPQVHRVIPVSESINRNLEIHPYESAAMIIQNSQSWGVVDCVCRTQKMLIGQACAHPLDVCLILSQTPGAFDGSTKVRPLSRQEAMITLQRAADAGLVHSVSNNQDGLWYICNCCTCSCGILRGMAEMGIANVVAPSSFVSQVDENLCSGCGLCLEACQFRALSLAETVQVDLLRCAGCGLCVPVCPNSALHLANRAESEPPPETENDWKHARKAARKMII